jgi:hypothetical protein
MSFKKLPQSTAKAIIDPSGTVALAVDWLDLSNNSTGTALSAGVAGFDNIVSPNGQKRDS